MFTITRAAMRLFNSACAVFTNLRRSGLVHFRSSLQSKCAHDNSTLRSRLQLPAQFTSISLTTARSDVFSGLSTRQSYRRPLITWRPKSPSLRRIKPPLQTRKVWWRWLLELLSVVVERALSPRPESTSRPTVPSPSKQDSGSTSTQPNPEAGPGESAPSSGSTKSDQKPLTEENHARTIKSVPEVTEEEIQTWRIPQAEVEKIFSATEDFLPFSQSWIQ